MSNKSKQIFGGPWTEEKLRMFNAYLVSYLTALKNQPFYKVYIDAFAGTGTILLNNDEEQSVIDGSAKRALSAELKFDHYYFIEYSQKKCEELKKMVHEEFSDLEKSVTIMNGDANEKLSELIKELDWRMARGLLFIDPFATAFKWESLKKVSSTHGIDLWYLFPYSALNRMLKRNGQINEAWRNCISSLLGTEEWERDFYTEVPQKGLFDDEPEHAKDADITCVTDYLLSRLKMVFPKVADEVYTFKNQNNAPMFLFFFAVSSQNVKAQSIAIRIASHIIKHH